MADSQVSLTELAERCEKAGGPEFAIDCKIEALIFDNHQGMMRSFTSSIDAAMTLVPEGWVEGYSRTFDAFASAACSFSDGTTLYSKAATPALALCAAALRARATQEQSNG